MRGIFVTGTDTGVGKTRAATALAHALASRGLRVHARKPVESGVDQRQGPADAQALRHAAGAHESLDVVCPLRLRAALSPERAARLEGVVLELEDLVAGVRRGVGEGGFVLLEGAGGFLSPIARGALNADLARAVGLPVVIVAADRLGTLNHTLLTIEAVRARGLDIAAIVLSQPSPGVDAQMDNCGELERWLGLPVWRLPHGSGAADAWCSESEALGGLADLLAGQPG